ncbi:DUF2304 domain-containing protein [Pseudarthrobacter quantipunctorum]|uniref:DUF2304 domain-containing protein n=1 Tax=Pseudarthrobacter quantipunctorum TaxID=3128980 RepID=A0ABZ2RCM8_9MICC
MIGSAITFCVAVLTVGIVIALVRQRKLREKYAVLWLFLGILTIVLTGFPQILVWTSQQFGVVVPANLIFSMALVLLVGVTLHLSWELSTVEDETRVLAEETAILRAATEKMQSDIDELSRLLIEGRNSSEV